jgi:hypothetical protein
VKRTLSVICVVAAIAALSPAIRAQDTAAVKKADTAVVKKPDTTVVAKADTTPPAPHIKSAYQDFRQRRVIELQFGYFAGNTGDAGVGPQGSPMIGLAYGQHLTGPVFAFGQVQYAFSKRTVLDPVLPPASRNLGTMSDPLIMVNAGILLSITGEKAWRGMVPTVGFSLGMALGGTTPDVGGYSFGSQFYLGIGAGLRKPIKGPWVVSVNLWDYLWQLHYPPSYFTGGSGSVLPVNAPDKQWANNGIFTIGLTYILHK